VKALTKEKKEKENVLTYLELANMKNAFMLQFEESKSLEKRPKRKKKKVDGGKKTYERNL
jgi:hypothetical protein